MRTSTVSVIVAVVLAWLVPWSSPAVAQGTMGHFPDPISTSELMRLMGRYMTVEQEQWPEFEAALDEYHAQFAALRDGDIQRALDLMDRFESEQAMPTKAQVENLLRRIDRTMTAIRALDDRLLDRIAEALEPGQLASLQRVRQARERRRNSSTLMTMWMMGEPLPDLSALVLEMDLPPDARETADSILMTYEPTLTRHVATLAETGSRMLMAIAETFEAAGLAAIDEPELHADPERMEEVHAVMEAAFANVMREGMGAARTVRDLNHRTRRQLFDALGDPHGRAVRDRYLAAAYHGSIPGAEAAELLVRRALAVDGIDDTARGSIAALRQAHLAADDRLVEELVGLVDQEEHPLMAMPMMADDDDADARVARAEAARTARERRGTLLGELHAALVAIVGADALPQFGPGAFAGDGAARFQLLQDLRQDADAPDAAGAPPMPLPSIPVPMPTSGDPLVPAPISTPDLRRWVRLMDLDADGRRLLETLHGTYLAEWDAEVRTHMDAIAELNESLARREAPTPERRDEIDASIHATRVLARGAAAAVDGRFLDEARSTVGDRGGVDWFGLFALERALADPGLAFAQLGVGTTGTEETVVNLVTMLLDRTEDRDLLPIVDRVVLGRADALRRTTAENVDAGVAHRRLLHSINRAYARAGGDPDRLAETFERIQREIGAAGQRSQESRRARLAAGHAVLDDLRVTLPEERMLQIERAYRRAAWPTLLGGLTDPVAIVEAALSMEDLDDRQASALTQLADDTSASLNALIDRLVEDGHHLFIGDFSSPEGMQRWNAHQQRSERILFERTEIETRTIQRLRAILTPEQATRLAPLRRYEELLRQREE